jgi:hypothetical protein
MSVRIRIKTVCADGSETVVKPFFFAKRWKLSGPGRKNESIWPDWSADSLVAASVPRSVQVISSM